MGGILYSLATQNGHLNYHAEKYATAKGIAMLKLLGYPDRYSVAPGEDIGFYISAEDNQSYTANLVRVVCGDCNPQGPGLIHPSISSVLDGKHFDGARQHTDAGSYMQANVRGLARSSQISFFATIWPTLVAVGNQTIFTCHFDGYSNPQKYLRLFHDVGGVLVLEVQGEHSLESLRLEESPLLERQWASIGFNYDMRTGHSSLHYQSLNHYPGFPSKGQSATTLPVGDKPWAAQILIAGLKQSDGSHIAHFNGKIDSPLLMSIPCDLNMYATLRDPSERDAKMENCLALWDFSLDMSSNRAIDLSPDANHGQFFQAPTRAMKGWNWSGENHHWTSHPEEYGAVHFHEDDLYDAAWSKSINLRIDPKLKSGAYALCIQSGPNLPSATQTFYIPFFVRPPRRAVNILGKRDRLAFLAPTVSYVAYANNQLSLHALNSERNIGRLIEMGHADLYMNEHPELAGSLYDKHRDGSGVAYSSRLRPVLNFTSQYHSCLGGHGSSLWQYNADTHLFAWLEAKGVDYDIITDEDMHFEGEHLLSDYRVIMTGTHPEYYSTDMWQSLKTWQDNGGRLMYLGGNGFYWHVALPANLPGMVEVRRAEDGIRTWEAEPGEYYHAATGELSGLFRRRGHAPNEICGLGFIAQGFDLCSYYRRMPDADNPRAAFIFEGVPDSIIGNFGLIGGGAAGLELDCMNVLLGTPPHALQLATSEEHTQQVLLVNEEFGVVPIALGGDQNERVRADIVFYETSSGGAVFSVGSISWCGSLPFNAFDNNVSRITENVLRRFMAGENF